MKRLFILIFLLWATSAFTAPIISSTSGTAGDGNQLVITGSGYGAKTVAAPLVFDDFDSNDVGRQDDDEIIGENCSHQGSWTTTYVDTIPTYQNINQRTGSTLSSYNPIVCADTTANHAPMTTAFETSHQTPLIVSLWMRYDWDSMAGSGNIKIWRIKDGTASNATNYTSLQYGQKDSQPMTSVFFQDFLFEGAGAVWPSAGDTTLDHTFTQATWQHYTVLLKASADDAADGSATISLDCVDIENTSVMETWDATDSWEQAVFGWYCASYTAGNVYLQFDDIYIDNSWQTVWLGNSATWAGCTIREIQIPSAWNTTEITITQNYGSFTSETLYLYVMDSDGNTNAAGYELQSGGGSTGFASGSGGAVFTTGSGSVTF